MFLHFKHPVFDKGIGIVKKEMLFSSEQLINQKITIIDCY